MKIKKSFRHVIMPSKQYGSTELDGGRAKLAGDKRGSRPWKVYRTCLCPGGKHRGPPKDIVNKWLWPKDGNPPAKHCVDGKPQWCTVCPLSAMQLVLGLQTGDKMGVYRKWLPSGRFGLVNENDMPELANQWMFAQDANPAAKYCSNGGRKCLARWCSEVEVPYRELFAFEFRVRVT